MPHSFTPINTPQRAPYIFHHLQILKITKKRRFRVTHAYFAQNTPFFHQNTPKKHVFFKLIIEIPSEHEISHTCPFINTPQPTLYLLKYAQTPKITFSAAYSGVFCAKSKFSLSRKKKNSFVKIPLEQIRK